MQGLIEYVKVLLSNTSTKEMIAVTIIATVMATGIVAILNFARKKICGLVKYSYHTLKGRILKLSKNINLKTRILRGNLNWVEYTELSLKEKTGTKMSMLERLNLKRNESKYKEDIEKYISIRDLSKTLEEKFKSGELFEEIKIGSSYEED